MSQIQLLIKCVGLSNTARADNVMQMIMQITERVHVKKTS